MPKVSICIPVYNGAQLISRALESCLAQTFRDIEIIVSDNASTDDTEIIVRQFQKLDSRIVFSRNSENIGLTRNFFVTYSISNGDYIQHLNADDWLDANHIEAKLQAFERNPKIAYVMSSIAAHTVNPDGSRPRKYFSTHKEGLVSSSFILSDLIKNSAYIGLTALARRKDVLEHFIPEIPSFPQFREYYLRGKIIDNLHSIGMVASYDSIYFTPNTTYRILIHERQSGNQYGIDGGTIEGKTLFVFTDIVAYDYVFSKKAVAFREQLRIQRGGELCANIFFDLLTRRASTTKASWGPIYTMFSFFSLKEKTIISMLLPFTLMKRLWQWFLRISG